MYSRTALLIGDEKMNKLKGSKVLVCGLGGVGGYVAEALARAGVGTLGLCDFDTVDESNINRQLIALHSNIGEKKTEAWKLRIADINPSCRLSMFDFKIDQNTLGELNIGSWDYVCDCIDDVPAKLALILTAKQLDVPVISSMGTGNKLNPSLFKIADIKKTEVDPLARAMRRRLREAGIDSGVDVLFSSETPVVTGELEAMPSISFVPSTAGLLIASHVIKGLIGLK